MGTKQCTACRKDRPNTEEWFRKYSTRTGYEKRDEMCAECRKEQRSRWGSVKERKRPDELLKHFPALVPGDVWRLGRERLEVKRATHTFVGGTRIHCINVRTRQARHISPKRLLAEGVREVANGAE